MKAVHQCVAVRAAVHGSAATCAAVRQRAAVRAAMCGSACGGVYLFEFNNYIICVI
jgi:hypothetical protein